MRSLSPAATAALAARPIGLAQLVTMSLTSTLRLNTTPWTLTWGGNDYLGAGTLGAIDVIEDSPGEVKGLQFQLSGIGADYIAICLAEPVQGKAVTIYTAIFDANSQVADAVLEWSGRLDTMAIREEGGSAVISVTAEHVGIDLLRPCNLLFSNQDQQRLFPGDDFSEYVIDQADQQIVWPAASWFRK